MEIDVATRTYPSFQGWLSSKSRHGCADRPRKKKLMRKCKANGGGIRENLPDIIPKEVIGQAASFALLNILVWLVPLRLQVFDYIAKDGSLGYIIGRIHHLNPASNDMKDPARSERKVGGLTSTRQWIRVALALRDTAMPLALC